MSIIDFFSIECSEVDVIFVSYARNSRDQTSLRLSPATHMCRKLCSKEIYSKTFLDVNLICPTKGLCLVFQINKTEKSTDRLFLENEICNSKMEYLEKRLLNNNNNNNNNNINNRQSKTTDR